MILNLYGIQLNGVNKRQWYEPIISIQNEQSIHVKACDSFENPWNCSVFCQIQWLCMEKWWNLYFLEANHMKELSIVWLNAQHMWSTCTLKIANRNGHAAQVIST